MGDQSIQETQPEDDAKGNNVQEDQPSELSSPFFVTISLHSGFRRLHKSGCWGTLPWTCHKVEYVSRVAEGVADAVCKICQRASGGKMEESASSSSGSSSSTDLEDDAALDQDSNQANQPVDQKEI